MLRCTRQVASFPRNMMLAVFPLIHLSLPENDSPKCIFYTYSQQIWYFAQGQAMVGRKPLPGHFQDTEGESDSMGCFITFSRRVFPELIWLPVPAEKWHPTWATPGMECRTWKGRGYYRGGCTSSVFEPAIGKSPLKPFLLLGHLLPASASFLLGAGQF